MTQIPDQADQCRAGSNIELASLRFKILPPEKLRLHAAATDQNQRSDFVLRFNVVELEEEGIVNHFDFVQIGNVFFGGDIDPIGRKPPMVLMASTNVANPSGRTNPATVLM